LEEFSNYYVPSNYTIILEYFAHYTFIEGKIQLILILVEYAESKQKSLFAKKGLTKRLSLKIIFACPLFFH